MTQLLKSDPTRPWKLCPHPQRWRCDGSSSVEHEVLGFLTSLVHLLKPEVIVETGTYRGDTARSLAEGCRLNGFGHVWTYDIEWNEGLNEGLVESEWITFRREDATIAKWDGPPIELLYCDGGFNRDKEILNFLPFLPPRGLIVAHDAADMSYGWNNLDGIVVPIVVACARGLYIMRKG